VTGRAWLKIAAATLGLLVAFAGMLGAFLAGKPLVGSLFSVLLLGMLVFGGIAAFRQRRPARVAPPAVRLDAFLGSETVAAPPPSQADGLEPRLEVAASRETVPAGFDAAGLLRAAKENFIRVQVARLRGRLDDLRDVITTDMYETLRTDTGAAGRDDVVTLNANLLEVATEAGRHRASVRFFGLVRTNPGAEAASFEQVWNLVKPVDSSNGWLLSGIQQMH
jgi:predicted lipid-binding transport protein (Tim44 family)